MNDKLDIACIRSMSLDMIDKANAGHPGTCLSAACAIHTLYTRHLISNNKNPNWIKRDRFVMSCGHASSLLYTILHLSGYDISLDELKNYKQLNSKTPGHPEIKRTPGVDISTGPLGQGIANAVGFAMAEAHLVATYPNLKDVLEHYTYCLCGDGCLEEGIGNEAMSIAGLYKLNKLIIIYDSNDCTLDGPLSISSIDNIHDKAISMGFNVIYVKDGNNNVDEIDKAIIEAKKSLDKPTLIISKTTIGYGSKLEGDHQCHGKPLGRKLSKDAKLFYDFDYEDFYIPESTIEDYKNTFIKRGEIEYQEYLNNLSKLSLEDKKDFDSLFNIDCLKDLSGFIPNYNDGYLEATRNVSSEIINYLGDHSNYLFGGVADVNGSVKIKLKNRPDFNSLDYKGNNINFGIREHAMSGIINAIEAHGGLKGYAGSFLVFSDYFRGGMRMSAMMELPVTYILSHDSIAVGEDGPTHQPVEQISSMRLIPNFNVIRPADARETLGAYKVAFSSTKTPTALCLTRQPLLTINGLDSEKVKYGAYIVSKEENKLDFIILASGSEVKMAMDAKEALKSKGYGIRVVSMPSMFLFDKQDIKYQESILPNKRITIAVELGRCDIYYKYADYLMDNEEFGLSAKYEDLLKEYKFTKEELIKRIEMVLK